MVKLKKPRYKIKGDPISFDERENVQARHELEQGTPEWEKFYRLHPEWEEQDGINKSLPGIGNVGHALDLPMLHSQRHILATLGSESVVDGSAAKTKKKIDPVRAAEKIKGFARHLGADLVKIGPLNQTHVYTHVGKTKLCPDKKRGVPILLDHKHAISIAVQADVNLIKTGPVLSELMEVMRVYTRLARISVTLAAYIRSLGYPARAHNLRNYLVLCVPIAIEAGMGELGRNGVLLTKELGNCLKIATVTTDLPMNYDPPVDIGVDEFCQDCKICAKHCPSGAIPLGGKVVSRGVEKWQIKPEACFKIWCDTGTDCGICLAVCPWNHPDSMFHRFCKEIAIRKKKAGLWISVGEELVYGRKFKPRPSPDWMELPDTSAWDNYKKLRKARPEQLKE